MLRLIDWVYGLITKSPLIFWACMAANALGVVWGGVVWYGPQMLASPLWAWPFIPDCPEAALWATVAFLLLRYGRARGWFTAFAAFGCIKYGIWTLMFWAKHWSVAGFGDPELPLELMLFVSHMGLTAEGVLLATRIGPLALPLRLGVIGWFALSIFVDYGLGFFPPLTYAVPEAYVFWVATALTTLLGAALLLMPTPALAPLSLSQAPKGGQGG
ncbi:DUF1405 domain-containing protein [Oscillochloris sp. ZM17-4]|nr:DUF1405 domain-containing protein [Oscillochloris sp. ZM17-4]